MRYKTTLTVRISDDLDKQLAGQSTALHVSKSDLAREALGRYLAVANVRVLRDRLAPKARIQGIHTDDHVFRRLDES